MYATSAIASRVCLLQVGVNVHDFVVHNCSEDAEALDIQLVLPLSICFIHLLQLPEGGPVQEDLSHVTSHREGSTDSSCVTSRSVSGRRSSSSSRSPPPVRTIGRPTPPRDCRTKSPTWSCSVKMDCGKNAFSIASTHLKGGAERQVLIPRLAGALQSITVF